MDSIVNSLPLSSPIISSAISSSEVVATCRAAKRGFTPTPTRGRQFMTAAGADGLDCIPPTRYRRPRFAFSASDPEMSAALRQTIESKMKTAWFLRLPHRMFTFAAKDVGAALMTVN